MRWTGPAWVERHEGDDAPRAERELHRAFVEKEFEASQQLKPERTDAPGAVGPSRGQLWSAFGWYVQP